MKMKRWISLLLTLALCLGLLPGVALAEEVTDTEIGLKLCADAAGTTEISKVDGVYNVGIAEGVTTTVYLHITGGDNAVFADGTSFTMTVGPGVEIVSSELMENNTVMKITHHGDRDWATMGNTRPITVGEEEFSFAIKFVNSDSGTEGDDSGNGDSTEGDGSTSTVLESGVYTTLTDGQLSGYVEMARIYGEEGPWGYRVDYSTSQSITVYYYNAEEAHTCTSEDVDYVAVEGMEGVYAITLHAGKSGEVFVDLTYGESGFPIVFDDGTDGDQGDSSSLQKGVYTTLTDGQLSGFVEMARIYGEEGPWGYRVDYTTGQSVTVYYYNAEKAHTCTSEDVDYVAVEGMDGVYAITLLPGKIGEVIVDLTLGDSGFPVAFSDGYSQMYYQFKEGSYATDIELSPNSSLSLEGSNLFADNQGNTAITVTEGYVFSLSDSALGEIVPPVAPEAWDTSTATANASGYLYAVKDDQKYFIAVSVKAQSGPPSGGNEGDEGDDSFYTLVSEKRDLTDTDKVGDDYAESGPAAFEYNGKTYYLCSMGLRTEEEGTYRMSYAGGSGQEYREGATFQGEYCIGIWTANAAKDYYTLIDGEEKTALLAAFESWSVTAYHSPDHNILDGYPATAYPEVYSWIDENGWPCGTMFKHYEDGLGNWYYAFTGKMKDGTTVTTYAKNGFHFIYDSLEYTATSIADANAKLQEWKDKGASLETDYQINLPAGELEGILVVPGGMEFVDINGSTSGERTVLRGGIAGEGHVMVHDIDFIGCGWWATNWPDNDVYGGEPNYGLYTAGGGQYKDCTFKNYFHALHCGPTNIMGHIIFGGTGTLFENNFIALYLNSTMNGGGDLQMTENIFRYNGCALWMENKGNRFSLNDYHLTRCEFYDNGWDVINLLGKCYFLPGQLFERDGQYGHGKFAGRRDALFTPPEKDAPDKAHHAAADVSDKDSGVYTFPVAKDDKFKDFDYTNKDAVIGNHNASEWLIPEKDLDGKTITVIQDEKGEDKVVWSFGE